jgi:hypothetical protein
MIRGSGSAPPARLENGWMVQPLRGLPTKMAEMFRSGLNDCRSVLRDANRYRPVNNTYFRGGFPPFRGHIIMDAASKLWRFPCRNE